VTYRVDLTEEADAELAALPKKVQRQIARKLRTLANNPRPPLAKRLEGVEHLYRLRSGDYRILYQIGDQVFSVLVVRIGHRQDVYRRLPGFRFLGEE
jgi:mRNA interferase RelE/StbE